VGKVLGIDYGLKRIGLATSDLSRTIASPLVTIQNKGEKKNIQAVTEIIQNHNIQGIMCGIALGIDGMETTMSRITREFGEKLAEISGLEVVYFNERYSSKEAEEHIRNNLGITRHEKIRELVDKMAASMVLQVYLDKLKKGF